MISWTQRSFFCWRLLQYRYDLTKISDLLPSVVTRLGGDQCFFFKVYRFSQPLWNEPFWNFSIFRILQTVLSLCRGRIRRNFLGKKWITRGDTEIFPRRGRERGERGRFLLTSPSGASPGGPILATCIHRRSKTLSLGPFLTKCAPKTTVLKFQNPSQIYRFAKKNTVRLLVSG